MLSKGVRLTPSERERLGPLFEERAMAVLSTRGRISIAEAIQILAEVEGSKPAFSCHYGRLANSLLAGMPNVVRMGRQDGYGLAGYICQPSSLRELVDLAAGRVRADYSGPRGPRTNDVVDVISEGQFTRIRVAAGFAAETIFGDSQRVDEVTEEHLGWDPGTRSWRILSLVAGHSDATARAKYESARRPNDPDWDPSMNQDRRKVHVQSLLLLLDLACTHGWITRDSGQVAPETATTPAPEWLPVRREWDAAYTANPLPNRRSDVSWGFRKLLLYATRLGFVRPDRTDWDAVREAITAAHAAGTADNNVLQHSRVAYNYLVVNGLIEAKAWESHRGIRMGLASDPALASALNDLDFSDWIMPDRRDAKALVESRYGVRDWTIFVTRDASDLETGGIPARELPRPTHDEKMAQARNPKTYRHKPRTARQELYGISYHAGFLASNKGIDWSESDLATLIDPEHLEAHIKSRNERKLEVVDAHMSSIAQTLTAVARPFLEAVAVKLADEHERAGRSEDARTCLEDADRFVAWSIRLLKLQTLTSPTGPTARREGIDRDGMSQEKVHAVWRAFTRDGVSGWEKLGWLQAALIKEIEEAGHEILHRRRKGTLPIAEQIALLDQQAGMPRDEWRFKPNLRWARSVRNATLVTLVRRVPLRPGNVSELCMSEWTGRLPGDELGPAWLGSSTITIPGRKMKGSRRFQSPFLKDEDRRDHAVLAMARPDLVQLYLMACGARDELRRLPDGFAPLDLPPDALATTDFVFPAEARSGSGKPADQQARIEAGLPWYEGGYGNVFRSMLRKYAGLLNLDLATLKEVGGMGPHIVRHLFGSHHCDVRRENALGPAATAVMLHHKSALVTERFYMGLCASDISVRGSSHEHVAAGFIVSATPAATRLLEQLREAADRVCKMELTPEEIDTMSELLQPFVPGG